MLSDLQDTPPRSTSTRPLKLVFRRPVDLVKVSAEYRGVESVASLSDNVRPGVQEYQTPSVVIDAPPMVSKESSKSPRPPKRSRRSPLPRLEDDAVSWDDESIGSTSNQLVLYSPNICNTNQDVLPLSDCSESYISTVQNMMAANPASRVLPSIGAFTVQCADCFKWRLIPTKEIYEEIREHILERPFTCERARAWRPDINCDDAPDISQDGSRLWAIDKPNIAQPPPGWERQLRIRGEGGTRFADVYYCAPSGKRLRSMVEVQKYLLEHPEYIEQGVKLSQFSFQIPRPLQENYVRKRPAVRMLNTLENGSGFSSPLDPVEVNPLSWVEPSEEKPLLPSCHGFSFPHSSESSPEKKKIRKPKILIKRRSTNSSVFQPAREEEF